MHTVFLSVVSDFAAAAVIRRVIRVHAILLNIIRFIGTPAPVLTTRESTSTAASPSVPRIWSGNRESTTAVIWLWPRKKNNKRITISHSISKNFSRRKRFFFYSIVVILRNQLRHNMDAIVRGWTASSKTYYNMTTIRRYYYTIEDDSITSRSETAFRIIYEWRGF